MGTHGDAMETMGTPGYPMGRHGDPRGTPWGSMPPHSPQGLHGDPVGTPLDPIGDFMGLLGSHGTSWGTYGKPWAPPWGPPPWGSYEPTVRRPEKSLRKFAVTHFKCLPEGTSNRRKILEKLFETPSGHWLRKRR